MNEFKADLHIHTVLSPCGDTGMSPANIIKTAVRKDLDIIGITDHNTTLQCGVVKELGIEKDIFVLCGTEVNSREAVHSLAFFEKPDHLTLFQSYLDEWLTPGENDPDKFGHQVQVDQTGNIIYEEKRLLFGTIDQSIQQIEKKVHELRGIFIPAHLDRKRNSLYSQLGAFPEDLDADAIEISWASNTEEFITKNPELMSRKVIHSSDAHFSEDIARAYSIFRMRNRSFSEICMAIKEMAGRTIRPE